jgi:hypothetical protein
MGDEEMGIGIESMAEKKRLYLFSFALQRSANGKNCKETATYVQRDDVVNCAVLS